jgi:hypothetical protein
MSETQWFVDVLAELVRMAEEHQGCQAKLDSRASDLARLTQSTVSRTKELEAAVHHWADKAGTYKRALDEAWSAHEKAEQALAATKLELQSARDLLETVRSGGSLSDTLDGLTHVEEPYRAKHLPRTVQAEVDTLAYGNYGSSAFAQINSWGDASAWCTYADELGLPMEVPTDEEILAAGDEVSDEERADMMAKLSDAFSRRGMEFLLRHDPEMAERMIRFADIAAEQAGITDEDPEDGTEP